MGRPRHGLGLKRPITLTLSEEAIAVLDQRGPTRSSAADALILGKASRTLEEVTDVDMIKEMECPHPKADEVKHAWGTQCGLCKKRLR